MEELELYEGVNVITETHDTLIDNVSHFTLKWANHLAKTNKVLYISWETDIEVTLKKLHQMGDCKSDKMIIDNRIEHNFTIEFFKIFEQVRNEKIEIIVFNEDPFFQDINPKELDIVTLFEFLVKKLNIKVIFSLPINHFWRMEPWVIRTNIRDYEIPRKIMNTCSQILFLHRPIVHAFNLETSINIDPDKLEIISLKNKELKEFVIKLDNKELKVF